MMQTNLTHYVGTHPYAFRSGQPARILAGFPEGRKRSIINGRFLPKHALFLLEWPDGKRDYAAYGDTNNYRLLTAKQAANYKPL